MAYNIELFTVKARAMQIGTESVSLCLLDDITDLTSLLNEKVAHLKDISEETLMNQGIDKASFIQAFECQLKAMRYELTSLPAIVFDGKEVIYGVDNLDEALRLKELFHD